MKKHQLNLFLKTLLLAICCSPFFSLSLQAQDCVEECECEGGLSEMTLFYLGDANATVRVYGDRDLTQLIDQFPVSSGDDFTVSAAGLAGGFFPYYLYFEVDDGVGNSCNTRIFSYCPSLIWPLSEEDLEIRGKRYGDLSVFSYRSIGTGEVCDLDDLSIEQNWKVGGNLTGPNNNRLGTLNAEPLTFITGNAEQGAITPGGFFGLGTTTPSERLEVDGRALIRSNGGAATLQGDDHVFLALDPNGGGSTASVGYLSNGTADFSIENTIASGDIAMSTPDDILMESQAVGVGVSAPDAKLHVAGDRLRMSANGQLNRYLEFNTDGAENEINSTNADMAINAGAGSNMAVNADNIGLNANSILLNGVPGGGPVAIHTANTPGSHSLYVGGSIIAEEIVVRLEANWPDYVFSDNYPRPNIREWAQFIETNHHLPGMPSAAEVAEQEGVAVGETQRLLLEKIEELTLIVIDQQKEIDELKARLDNE